MFWELATHIIVITALNDIGIFLFALYTSLLSTLTMKLSIVSLCLALTFAFSGVESFAPATSTAFHRTASSLAAKYNTMDEILALFPEEKPVLINFYDAGTEKDIKDDMFRAKNLLKDRASFVSIKQQDYPELAKLWDCAEKSPSMILFKDGKPVTRMFEQTFYLDIVAKVGTFCDEA
jgi:hypothetical protein